jgi:transposase-like protein
VGSMRGIEAISTRQNRWAELMRQQAQSGLSVNAFCRRHGVSNQSFYSWRKRLSSKIADEPVRFALVETEAPIRKGISALELLLASGDRLRISAGTDAATLRTVLQVLREHA